MIASRIFNENERLQELLRYNILDSPQEQDFDDVVKLASYVCNASIGLVTFVDECRQWFKAKVGWEHQETSRDISFCAHTIHQDQLMEVKDTLEDKRFSKNPLVVEGPKVRFYAGVPLISPSGHKLGTLCVLDQEPRTLTEKQEFALEVLANYIVLLLELRLKKQSLVNSQREHESLRESMHRQQRALTRAQRAARIGMFELELSKNLLKVSEGFCHLFGMKLSHTLASDELTKLIYPEDLQGLNKYLQYVMKSSSKRFAYDYRCSKKNTKKEIFIRCTGEVVRNETGEAIQLIGVKQDITEQKWYEKQLEDQNAVLLKVNQELDNFVYRVSHDLRAPISSLLGLVAVIMEENDLVKVKELLQLARKTLEKQDRFIKDILDYSRNSRQELQLEEVDLEELLTDIFSQFTFSGQQEKPEHSFTINQQFPFFTDAYRLRIILNNLIANAFKYMKPGKAGGWLHVKVEVRAQEATFLIEDNGIGIDKKHLDKVFNMFYRATDYHPGSGLGLYIVKETATKLGGAVNVESEAGVGTTLRVVLPNLKNKS